MTSSVYVRWAALCYFFTNMVAGASWLRIALPVERAEVLACVQFTDPKTGFILAGGTTLLKTETGGQRWTATKMEFPGGTGTAGSEASALRLWFTNKDHGWATGAIGRHGAIWETHDAGLRWNLKGEWSPSGKEEYDRAYGGDVYFPDALHGWVVGGDSGKAMIWATNDGGGTWKSQYVGDTSTGSFQRVRFANNETGWVLGPITSVRTDSGGASWNTQTFEGSPNDVSAVDGEVWVAAGWGALYYSRAKGADLQRVTLNSDMRDSYLAWVTFTSRENGWISAAKGKVFSTRDGGLKWQDVSVPNQLLGSDGNTYDMTATKDAVYVLAAPASLLMMRLR